MRMAATSLLAATLTLLPVYGQAQAIGTVLTARGQVSARAENGSLRTLTRRAPVFQRDTLLTGTNGFIQIKMVDDARLSLRRDTEFTFDEYVFDGNTATPDTAVMSLRRGCFISISGSIGDSTNDVHRIDTPVATITIRGTLHSGSFDGAALYTATYEGGTTVSSAQGTLDVGIGGGPYDFTVTRAGSAPEGLLMAPDLENCMEAATPTATGNMATGNVLGSPPPDAHFSRPAAPSSAPSTPASALQDP